MDSHALPVFLEEDLMLMAETEDFFMTNPTKILALQVASFQKDPELVVKNLRDLYT